MKNNKMFQEMKKKFTTTVNACILLVVAIIMGSSVEGIGQEQLLSKQFDLNKERSLKPQHYEMEVEIIARASNGSIANVETYSMSSKCTPGDLSAGKPDTWTCSEFTIKLGNNPVISIPSLERWTYDFNRGIGIDEHGQVMGISHSAFEELVDNNGKKLDAIVAYQVYNQFVQFHAYVDQFAAADLEGGKGIQDLKRIGDRIVFDEFNEDLPLTVGLIIKEGSVYKPGMETLDFKGLSLVDDKSCVLLGVDGGEGSYTMVMEIMPDMNAKTVGGTRYFGYIYVDLASMWLKKAAITVIDVTETSMGGNVIDNSTIESHYAIRMIKK